MPSGTPETALITGSPSIGAATALLLAGAGDQLVISNQANAQAAAKDMSGIEASGGLPDNARDLAPTVPMKRSETAQDMAKAIAFLVSDAASYTTGTILDMTSEQ
jgi:NAD(P)-dependent dehydrogenase (short-subunit alcohol dehydrogenase family)